MNLEATAKRLELKEEETLLDGYDVRNFAVHTGLSGVIGFDRTMFELMSSKALRNIVDCMISALSIVGRELQIHTHIDVFDRILAALERAKSLAVADQL